MRIVRTSAVICACAVLLSSCAWKNAPSDKALPPAASQSSAPQLSKAELEALAAKGDASAQFELGAMHHDGEGVQKDFVKARQWFEKSAANGDVRAQFNLGVMQYQGEGMAQNFAKAKQWFTTAADAGNPRAQFNLGVMYYRGEGMKIDLKKAHELFTASAMQNFEEAQFNLGVMEAKGESVPVDITKAYAWFTLALENGNPRAQEVLQNIEREVTPEQLKELKAAAAAQRETVLANVKRLEAGAIKAPIK